MWKLYSQTNEAIAIKTTYNKFIQSFIDKSNERIIIDSVKYIDCFRDDFPLKEISNPFFHKRKSFEHEKEFRAVIPFKLEKEYQTKGAPHKVIDGWKDLDTVEGKAINVDLDKLIDSIFIAPTALIWFKKLVHSSCKKHGLEKPIKYSQLDAKTPIEKALRS